MPFGEYSSHADCVAQNQDADDPDAYCASIEQEIEGKSEDGYSFRDLPDEARKAWIASFKESFGKNDGPGSALVAWATVLRHYELSPNGRWTAMKVMDKVNFRAIMKEDRVIYGAASVEIVDADNELITEEALLQAFKSYQNRGQVLFFHRNVPVGEVIPNYRAKDGTEYVSGVKDGKLNVVVRLYKDTEIANEVWAAIEKGQLRAFSIGGQIIGDTVKVCPTQDSCYNRIDKLDLHEISIVPEPANEASYFGIVKSKITVSQSLSDGAKLKALESLINDEKMKALNCPRFTNEAMKIMKGETNMTNEDTTKLLSQLVERIAKVEDALKPKVAKEEHPEGCPEGQHMVDGECVPMAEKKAEEKKETLPAPAPAPPALAPVPKETDVIRAQIGELSEAFKALTAATAEIAGLKKTLTKGIRVEEEIEEPGRAVTFDPNRGQAEYSDWTDKVGKGASFDERAARIAKEMDPKPAANPAGSVPTVQNEMDALKTNVSSLMTTLHAAAAEIKQIREKQEIGELRAQVLGLSETVGAAVKEVTGLKDGLAKAAEPVKPAAIAGVPGEKRTVDVSSDMVHVVDWDGASRSGSFDARMRKLQKEYGITQ